MLKIEELSKRFGGLDAVSNLATTIERGDITGLIGPNGAGKTTVFNLITGFLKPTHGRIIWNGLDITAKSPHDIAARGISRTFQAINVFPEFTVLDNIVLACHLKAKTGFWQSVLHSPGSRRRDREVLKKSRAIIEEVGLAPFADIFAHNLAHGHKRILGIAIALAAEPRLLLLDEPLGGMNGNEVSETIALINKLAAKNITILLIEHNMRAAMSLCRKIVVLNFGQKIAEGSPQQIKRDDRVIQAYLGSSDYAAGA